MSVIKKVVVVTWLVDARAITDPKIGPTHGVQTIPMVRPITNPPQKPVCDVVFGAKTDNLEKSFSMIV